jgi:hypothetical protein
MRPDPCDAVHTAFHLSQAYHTSSWLTEIRQEHQQSRARQDRLVYLIFAEEVTSPHGRSTIVVGLRPFALAGRRFIGL